MNEICTNLVPFPRIKVCGPCIGHKRRTTDYFDILRSNLSHFAVVLLVYPFLILIKQFVFYSFANFLQFLMSALSPQRANSGGGGGGGGGPPSGGGSAPSRRVRDASTAANGSQGTVGGSTAAGGGGGLAGRSAMQRAFSDLLARQGQVA